MHVQGWLSKMTFSASLSIKAVRTSLSSLSIKRIKRIKQGCTHKRHPMRPRRLSKVQSDRFLRKRLISVWYLQPFQNAARLWYRRFGRGKGAHTHTHILGRVLCDCHTGCTTPCDALSSLSRSLSRARALSLSCCLPGLRVVVRLYTGVLNVLVGTKVIHEA